MMKRQGFVIIVGGLSGDRELTFVRWFTACKSCVFP